jgi:hypothetical protein
MSGVGGNDGREGNLQSDNQSSTAVGSNHTTTSNRSIFYPSSFSGNPTANNSVLPQSLQSSVTLSYPYDFFNTKTGLGPKDAAEAVALWPYRKHRPAHGTVDPEPADGMKMMMEVQGMRERLKSHIEKAFMKDARMMAAVWKLHDPRTNQTPHTLKDFVRALVALKRVEGSLDNERIVYMVCHHFHHQREWLSNAVDAWCLEEKIKIEHPHKPKVVDGVRKRSSPSNRGGFGVYARNVKSEIVKQLMRNMLSRSGWSISTKDNSKQGKGKKYEAITIRIESTLTDHTCYVVMEEDAAKKAAGKNKDGGSATMGSSADNPIEADHFVGIGAHICSNLGVAVSEERLHEMFCNYKPQSDVLGLQIGTGIKSPEGDMSDLTSVEAAVAHVSTSIAGNTAAPPMTVAHTHQQPVSTTAAHTAAGKATLSNTAAPSLTTATSDHLPLNSSAAHFGNPSLTTATSNHQPVSSTAVHSVAPSLTTATGNHQPVSSTAAHSVAPSLTTATSDHLPLNSSAAHFGNPSLTTATSNHQPVSSTAAHSVAPSLTTATSNHQPVSSTAAHSVAPSLTTATSDHLPVSSTAAHSSLTTATSNHLPVNSTAAHFTVQTAMASILLLGAPV